MKQTIGKTFSAKIRSLAEIYKYIQWNLSIADMLYSGHLVIADTFCSDRENLGQTLLKNPLYCGQFIADTRYNGHVFSRLWRKINLYSGQFGNLFKTIRENNDQSIQNTPGMLFTHNFLLKITENLYWPQILSNSRYNI